MRRKYLLTAVLTVTMLLGTVPMPALAADTAEAPTEVATEEAASEESSGEKTEEAGSEDEPVSNADNTGRDTQASEEKQSSEDTIEADEESEDIESENTAQAAAADESSAKKEEKVQFGDNIYATIDAEGTLTLTGTGKMWNRDGLGDSRSPRSPYLTSDTAIQLEDVKAVVISEGITTVARYAFANCTNLSKVTLPEGLTKIGDYAFYKCSLENLELPSSVVKIGDEAFAGYNVESLRSVTLNEGLQSIGAYAFRDGIFTDIAIPETVTEIGKGTFFECQNLQTVTLPSKMTTISDNTFFNCWKLAQVTLPDTITSIGSGAFSNCRDLSSINIPSFLRKIGSSAFGDCISLSEFDFSKTVLTSVGSYAFQDCTSLSEIILPDTVDSIGSGAFSGCTGLTEISIPDGVESIGSSVFSGCTGLTEISIPDGVDSIGDLAFVGCTGITEISIPDSVNSIGSSAFSGCTGLAEISIPDGVESIGSSAFSGCTGLTKVNMPEGLAEIGEESFSGCTSLTAIKIPESVEIIDYEAFSGCTELKDVGTLPSGLTGIYRGVFKSTAITSIVIPEGVESIGYEAFKNCSKLQNVSLPDTVNDIGMDAFYGDKSIQTITLPEELERLDESAFYGTGLTDIYIPYMVNYIGNAAFGGCKKLKSVHFSGNCPSFGGSNNAWLSGCGNITIYYPDNDDTWTDDIRSEKYGAKSIKWVETSNKKTTLNWNKDVFSFKNFSHKDGCAKHISNSSKMALMAELEPSDKKNIEEHLEKENTGHCYGMSTAVCMNKTGLQNFANMVDTTDHSHNLYKLKKNKQVESLLCGDHAIQFTKGGNAVIQSFIDRNPTPADQIKEITKEVSQVKIGGNPVRISFRWSIIYGHTVVGYNVVSGSYSVDGVYYTKKIELYDCNYPDDKETSAIYCNDIGQWCNPAYSSCSSADGAKIVESSNTWTEYNNVKNTDPDYVFKPTVCFGREKAYQVLDKTTGESYVLDPSEGYTDDSGEWKSYVDLSDSENSQINYILPKDTDTYEFTPLESSDGKIDLTILYDDSLYTVTSDSADKVEINPSGEINLTGNEGSYEITIADDKKADENYHTFTVSGESQGNVSAALTNEGVDVKGESEQTVINAEGEQKSTEKTLTDPIKDGDTVSVTQDGVEDGKTSDEPKEKQFSDVTDPANSYYNAIYWAAGKGITTGYSDGTFGIGKNCSRGAFVTFLWRQQGSPEPTLTAEKSGLKDFSSIGKSYQKAVLWAVENGITTGYRDKTFRAGANVTRGAAVTFLYRAAGQPKVSITRKDVSFTDMVPAESSYEPGILWAVENKITTGYKDNTFRPGSNCVRGATVTFLQRFDNLK